MMAPWKCPDCGTWWSGLEHRCAPTNASPYIPFQGRPEVIRLAPEPTTTTSVTSLPYCPICRGWHHPWVIPCSETSTGA